MDGIDHHHAAGHGAERRKMGVAGLLETAADDHNAIGEDRGRVASRMSGKDCTRGPDSNQRNALVSAFGNGPRSKECLLRPPPDGIDDALLAPGAAEHDAVPDLGYLGDSIDGRFAVVGNELPQGIGKRLQLDRDRALLDRLIRATGRTVLTASREADPALEGYRGHGIFTYALLEGLALADDNRNGTVEMSELSRYLGNEVPELSRKAFGWRQIPQMKQVGSDFALIRTSPASSQDAVAPTSAATAAGSAAPEKSTHVVITPTGVRQNASSVAPVVVQLAPGAQVVLVETSGGWVLVARGGKRLGYVEAKTLLRLQ